MMVTEGQPAERTATASLPSAPVARVTPRPVFLLLLCVLPLLPLQNIIEKVNGIIRGIPGVNFLNLSALALIVAWLLYTLGRGRPLLRPTRFNRVLLLWMAVTYLGLWRAVMYVDAPVPLSPTDPSFVFWKDSMICFLLYFVAANTLEDERSMRRLLFAMFLVLPYMIFVHRNHLMWASSWHYDHDMRVHGTMLHLGSNELAAFYVYGLLIALSLLMTVRDLQWRVVYLAASLLLGWGVIYSYSRSAYIAALAGVGIIGLLRSLKVTAILLAFLLVAPIILPASVMDRFGMINSEQTKTDESTERRMELWQVAWDRFTENPVLGTGYRSFTHLNRWNMDTHNYYLKVLCELGVGGALLYLAQLWIGFRQGWTLSLRRPTPFAQGLGMGLMAAAFAALILNLFGDRSSYLAVTGYYWCWQGMGARILYGVEHEGGWSR